LRRLPFIAVIAYLAAAWAPLATAGPLPSAPGAGLTGRWITPHRGAVIQIAPCGADLCGQIVAMQPTSEGNIPTDWAGATQCHLTIIQAAPHEDGAGHIVWSGRILDPRDGSTYHATIALDPSHRLRVRGYIGLPIFGQTQVWTQYRGAVVANCRFAPVQG
jgi:uncharacterized protein (DUF2147 family)